VLPVRRFAVSFGVLVVLVACSGCGIGFPSPPTILGETSVRLNGEVTSTTGGEVKYWWRYGRYQEEQTETLRRTVTLEPYEFRSVSTDVEELATGASYDGQLCVQDEETAPHVVCSRPRGFGSQSEGCGQVITSDTTLTRDLTCYGGAGPALTIAADDVTLDMDEHTVTIPFEFLRTPDYIVLRSIGNDRVTIKNGAFRYDSDSGFSGIANEISGSRITLRNVGFWGGVALGVDHSRIVDTDASNYWGTGVALSGHHNTLLRVRASVVDGLGLSVDGSENRLLDSHAGGWRGAEITGDHNVFRGGTIGSVRGDALVLTGSDTQVRNSEIRGAADFAVGVRVVGATDGVLALNIITAGSTGQVQIIGSTGTRLSRNTLNAQSITGDGIHVDADSFATLLARNSVHGASDDGIEIDSPDTRLRANTTNNNGDLGIEAVAGVIDLGGNTASGNGNPLQCVNVFCQ
jgi:hypothetical protein